MKRISGKTVAITVGIICILLTATLVSAITNYNSILNTKDAELKQKNSIINNLNSQITENENTISSLNDQIANQTSQIQTLANQTNELQTWLNGNITTLSSQITNLQNHVSSLNSQIATLQNQTSSDQSTITNLQGQVTSANSQVNSLNSTITTLQNQTDDLTSIINMSKTQLHTLVFHVCEKGDEYVWKLPDVNATYNQILALNNTYNVLLLPEYKSHSNWTEELSWLTANFGGKEGIPIMLDVFASAEDSNPITKLSTDEILAAMAVCNVQYVRLFEVISWHMDYHLPFPVDYVSSILNFCRANELKVFWSEWKTDHLPSVETFTAIQNYITGYEDIVTVSFGTNSQDEQPPDGLLELRTMFPHWGASIQAWYWDTYNGADPIDMPISLLIQHALSAKQIGAEILQFEPYWYFFDNGRPNDNLWLLQLMLG